jgi:transcriptional regulator GlxA family with amidase domain
MMTSSKAVAIILFNEVEVLDFAGPFEVFSTTAQDSDDGRSPFQVFTVAETTPILARNQLSINPDYALANCPSPDILLIPGGGGYHANGEPYGSRREMHNPVILDWVSHHAQAAELILSVCTGALILAQARLLDGLAATTHHDAIEALNAIAPQTRVMGDRRVVDNGRIILSAGVSAGIDMSLYVVAKLLGNDQALHTATHMEYDWRPDELTMYRASEAKAIETI